MESEPATAASQVKVNEKSRINWQILWFFPHVIVLYGVVNFCTAWLAGWTHGTLLPLLEHPSSSSYFEFFYSHLLIFSVIPAFVSGLLFNLKWKQRVAEFVWLVPTAILLYKFYKFSDTSSVFQRQSSAPLLLAFHHYFSSDFLIAEYRDWTEFWQIVRSNPDMLRGMDQFQFTAPFYAGVAYSVAAWIALRTRLDEVVITKVKQWEGWKFGPLEDECAHALTEDTVNEPQLPDQTTGAGDKLSSADFPDPAHR